MIKPVIALALLPIFLAAPTLEAAAPPASTADKASPVDNTVDIDNPPFDLTDEARIEKGRLRFGANCAAYCHGHEGSGGKVPAFKGRTTMVPEEVFKVITYGRRGADVMPAWGRGFSEEKRWELVAYIMWLTRQKPD